MSIDLTNVSAKTDLPAPPTPPPGPDPAVVYARQKTRLCQRLERQLTNSGVLPITVRAGFLTEEDKTALVSGLESKGYTVTEDGFRITIS